MPGMFYQPVSRRSFLLTATRGLAGAALIPECRLAGEEASEKPVHLALISDTHVAADPKNEAARALLLSLKSKSQKS